MNEKTKRQNLITFYFIFVLFGVSIIIIDALIPVIAEEIKVGFDRIGIALFAGSIAALLANFVAGRLSDRIDIKRIVISGLILLSAGFALFSINLNFFAFFIFTILLRTGFGTIDTSVHSFSSKLFKNNISRIFLNLDIAWYFGAVMGPLAVSGILYFEFLPRYVFLLFAFFYMVFTFIFFRICPGKTNRSSEVSMRKEQQSKKSLLKVLNDPAVIVGSIVLFIFLGALMGLSTWMTTYLLGLGIKVAYGSAILSLYWLFSIIGMFITVRIIAKFKEIHILFYSCLAGIIFLALFSFTSLIYLKILALALQAICLAALFPLTTAITVKRDTENSGTILGFTIAFAFAGSIVYQPLYGYIAEYFGKEYIAYIALVGSLIGFIFVSALFIIIRKDSSRHFQIEPLEKEEAVMSQKKMRKS